MKTGLSELNERRERRRISWLLASGVVFVLLLLGTAGAKGFRDLQSAREREQTLAAGIAAAQGRIHRLEQRRKLLLADPVTLERLAREELGLVRPDEWVFVVSEEGLTPAMPATQSPGTSGTDP